MAGSDSSSHRVRWFAVIIGLLMLFGAPGCGNRKVDVSSAEPPPSVQTPPQPTSNFRFTPFAVGRVTLTPPPTLFPASTGERKSNGGSVSLANRDCHSHHRRSIASFSITKNVPLRTIHRPTSSQHPNHLGFSSSNALTPHLLVPAPRSRTSALSDYLQE
jgi:hypothetical protein